MTTGLGRPHTRHVRMASRPSGTVNGTRGWANDGATSYDNSEDINYSNNSVLVMEWKEGRGGGMCNGGS